MIYFDGSIGDITQRLCTAAEIKYYFNGFFTSTTSTKKTNNYLKPNKNCNLSSWVSGCEPGWACSAGSQKVDLKSSKDMPVRTTNCAACCEGFFCPNGITCMIRKYILVHQMIMSVTRFAFRICHNHISFPFSSYNFED
jgi:hypothetical protein